ncbi:MAG: O-antigen ligase family protein [Lachnospiraceae bacterium]|nr:O-antigen ligase family protein [Lachnospiraceae bacterium]
MEDNKKKDSRIQKTSEQKTGTGSGRFSGATENKNRRKVNYSGGYAEKNEDNYFLLLVGAVLTILPLIVRATKYDPKLSGFDWFSATTEILDVFLIHKYWVFIIIIASMVLCLGMSYFNGKRKFNFEPIFIPLGIYFITCLLSTIFSEYSSFGWNGIYEQFESVFCLAGYCVLVYFVYTYVRGQRDIHTLINFLAYGALIIGLLGTFQGMKMDLFRSDFGKNLLASAKVPAQMLDFSFEEGRTYATLYNPNYVGVYATLVVPIFTVLVIYTKKMWDRVLYGLVVLTTLISMFAAQFKAGIVSLAMVGVIILVLLRKTIIKKWFITIPVVIGIIGVFILVDTVNGHNYSKNIANAFKIEKLQEKALSAIETKENNIEIVYNNQKYYFSATDVVNEDGTISYSDHKVVKEDGSEVEVYLAEDQSRFLLRDENLQTFSIYNASSVNGFVINIEGKDWCFIKREDGYKYYNRYGKEAVIETAETALFDGYEDLASKRGFIWGRTIPLLKNYLLLGSGADTFSIVFPQHDYVALYNNGYEGQLISKPHCLYLQVAVQTGVLSLLALLVFYGMYFVQCIRLYSKGTFDNYLSVVGVSVFVGTIGYMVSSITNDSSITVAPVFWAIMGIGVTVNAMVKSERAD